MGDTEWNIDCNDISNIFKNSLRIENKLKSIGSIFFNERFSGKIDYKPYFQRNYVWDADKGSYFIESILLGTEIPPLVLFDNQVKNEVIDGRQRYETIEKFINNRLVLTEDGLHVLKSLAGKTYCDLEEEIREVFEDTKIRILQCTVVNEPHLTEEKEDKIKKEIFRRYNSGITPLHKEEIQRAEFIDDKITQYLNKKLLEDEKLLNKASEMFLSIRQQRKSKRDSVNILLAKIRLLLVLPNVPINNYANSSSKSDVVSKAYYYFRLKLNEDVEKFETIINILYDIKSFLEKEEHELKDSTLLYECLYWAFAILTNSGMQLTEVMLNDVKKSFSKLYDNGKYWVGIKIDEKNVMQIFQKTGSHYYKSILYRYKFVANIFSELFKYNFDKNFNDIELFKTVMSSESCEVAELEKFKIHKADPTSMTIEDIMKKIGRQKFVIRPNYQRSEVINIGKSSYLMESIMLDMKIPPIYIYKRSTGVFEVIDGQQRLLTIMGFLGKTYMTDEGKEEKSQKHLFKLKNLKILDELNGRDIESIPERYKDKILDFQIDVVEIDSNQNKQFDNIDLFLRLNTKPYPIRANSFEMWNAYVNKEAVVKIKNMAEENEGKIFRKKDTRMSIEELITSLAYLDYKKQQNIAPYTVLNIYKRNNRINARIKKKDDITKILANISKEGDRAFFDSINNVNEFIEKVWKLLDNRKENISMLFASANSNGGKTDQNFYILWLLLMKIKENQIEQSREILFGSIQSIFKKAQFYDADSDAFIKEIQEFSL